VTLAESVGLPIAAQRQSLRHLSARLLIGRCALVAIVASPDAGSGAGSPLGPCRRGAPEPGTEADALSSMEPSHHHPRRVLIVCTGDICRSLMAERLLRHQLTRTA